MTSCLSNDFVAARNRIKNRREFAPRGFLLSPRECYQNFMPQRFTILSRCLYQTDCHFLFRRDEIVRRLKGTYIAVVRLLSFSRARLDVFGVSKKSNKATENRLIRIVEGEKTPPPPLTRSQELNLHSIYRKIIEGSVTPRVRERVLYFTSPFFLARKRIRLPIGILDKARVSILRQSERMQV